MDTDFKLPTEEAIRRSIIEGTPLGDLNARHEVSLWALLMLLGETGIGYYILIHKLREKGILTDEDMEEISTEMANPAIYAQLYEQMLNAFEEKYKRIVFASLHPDKVEEYVKKKQAGEEVVDPMEEE